MKNESNQENIVDFGETAFSSVNINSHVNQATIEPSGSPNFQNNNENNIRLIKVNKPIQVIKYCSNSIRLKFFNFSNFVLILILARANIIY